MSALTYVTETGGDWEALYIDGRDDGPCQNHSLDTFALLQALEGKSVDTVEHLEVDCEEGEAEWMTGEGFPYYLSDIPKEARIP